MKATYTTNNTVMSLATAQTHSRTTHTHTCFENFIFIQTFSTTQTSRFRGLTLLESASLMNSRTIINANSLDPIK